MADEPKRKKEYLTDDKGRKLMRYEGTSLWQIVKEKDAD